MLLVSLYIYIFSARRECERADEIVREPVMVSDKRWRVIYFLVSNSLEHVFLSQQIFLSLARITTNSLNIAGFHTGARALGSVGYVLLLE